MFKFKKWAVIGLTAMIGVMGVSCTDDDDDPPPTYVRFTWEADEQPNILAIAGSYNDVNDWYDEVYDAELADIYGDDGDGPLFNGSKQLPDNIYSSTLQSTQHKGKYYEIKQGTYTAICSAFDEYAEFDIVANYAIHLYDNSDPDVYFEIGFDVAAIIEDWYVVGHWAEGWYYEWYDNPNTTPMLSKSLKDKGITVKKSNVRTFKKNGSEMKLSFTVVRKPKN